MVRLAARQKADGLDERDILAAMVLGLDDIKEADAGMRTRAVRMLMALKPQTRRLDADQNSRRRPGRRIAHLAMGGQQTRFSPGPHWVGKMQSSLG